MNLRAFSDRHRIWIEDVDTGRDDPAQVHLRFRVPKNSRGLIPKRAEKRLMEIAETMAEAANRAFGHPDTGKRPTAAQRVARDGETGV